MKIPAIFCTPPPPAAPVQTKFPVIVRNEADRTEILIHGPIGRSWWSEEGVSSNDFIAQLKAVPAGRKIVIGINSQGGSIQDGLAIYNAIQSRSADITCRVDGYAVSIASVFPLAASRVISPKSSVWMIHDPWSITQGSADDMRKAAEMLDTHAEVLVAAYAEKTGKTPEAIRTAMKAETWLTGAEALDWGLADEANDEPVTLAAIDFAPFSHVPQSVLTLVQNSGRVAGPALPPKNSAAPVGASATPTPKPHTMKRDQIIALLKKRGIQVADDATDEQLLGLLETSMAAKPEPKDDVTKAVSALERKLEVKSELARLVAEKRITQAQADKALPAALKDDTVLAMLRENPVMPVAAEPVAADTIEIKDGSAKEIETGFNALRAPVVQALEQRTKSPDTQRIAANAIAIATMIGANLKKLMPALNANTISADLKRNVMLTQAMRAFKRKLISLQAFSTVFNNVPLLGTAKIAIPFYPLHETASASFVDGAGYVFSGHGTVTNDIEVTVNLRKYQPFAFYSHELARQPFFNVARLLELKAEQLGVDVVADVMSLILNGAFGAAAKTEQAAAFDTDDVADIAGVCDDVDWPDVGRSLFLDTDYITALRKDPALKQAQQSGSDQTLREGSIGRVAGFDVFGSPRIPANAENLVGFASMPQGLLVATSPIAPGPGVRKQLISYDVVTDPDSGISFEYRYWGDADQDEEREVIEVNYGKAAGDAAALKRIVSA